MTDSEIFEIEKRLNNATKGPWKSMVEGRDHGSGASFIITGIEEGENIWNEKRRPDIYIHGATISAQEFIAHAEQDIPKLLAENKRLKSK